MFRGVLESHRLRLSITVGGTDAAQTAILCGGVCAAVYPLLGFTSALMQMHSPHIEIQPDYTCGDWSAHCDVKARVALWWLLVAGVLLSCADWQQDPAIQRPSNPGDPAAGSKETIEERRRFKMNENNHVSNILDVTVEKMRSVADADTIIGDRIELAEGSWPFRRPKSVHGFASGGSDFRVKSSPKPPLFGGGGGCGMTVTPVGFLVCKGADVRLVPVTAEESAGAGAIALLPELFDKLIALLKRAASRLRTNRDIRPTLDKRRKLCYTRLAACSGLMVSGRLPRLGSSELERQVPHSCTRLLKPAESSIRWKTATFSRH